MVYLPLFPGISLYISLYKSLFVIIIIIIIIIIATDDVHERVSVCACQRASPEQAVSAGDLVAEAQADLRSREGHLLLVVVQQPPTWCQCDNGAHTYMCECVKDKHTHII
jgi:hypothetical protein